MVAVEAERGGGSPKPLAEGGAGAAHDALRPGSWDRGSAQSRPKNRRDARDDHLLEDAPLGAVENDDQGVVAVDEVSLGEAERLRSPKKTRKAEKHAQAELAIPLCGKPVHDCEGEEGWHRRSLSRGVTTAPRVQTFPGSTIIMPGMRTGHRGDEHGASRIAFARLSGLAEINDAVSQGVVLVVLLEQVKVAATLGRDLIAEPVDRRRVAMGRGPQRAQEEIANAPTTRELLGRGQPPRHGPQGKGAHHA